MGGGDRLVVGLVVGVGHYFFGVTQDVGVPAGPQVGREGLVVLGGLVGGVDAWEVVGVKALPGVEGVDCLGSRVGAPRL